MTHRLRLLLSAFVLLLTLPATAVAQWETPSRAFHKAAIFPLEGRHLTVPCASCHIKGQVQGTPTACADCHWIRRQDDPYKTRLGMQCEQCHQPTSWTAVKWDHAAATGMPLNGAHRTLGCDSCHKNGLFTTVTLGCATCHQKDFDTAKTPDHRAAGFPTNCELCHRASDVSFTEGRFDHNATYPLTGVHATLDCASCHRNGVYQGTPRDCVGCHRTDYDKTSNPNHAAAGFPTTCEACHRPTDPSWSGGTPFNHNAYFSLVGVHATVACQTCHVNNVYQGTPRDCYGCHRTNYDKTTSPNHASAGFPTSCDTCHKPTDPNWTSGGTFNHNSVFSLVGVHATVACQTCHVNNVYQGTPRDCVGCHRTDYDKTTSPNHAAAGFPTTCDACHRPTDPSWKGATTFDHNTVFALVGVHATVACQTCHVNNVYQGTPRDCVGCHRTDYDRTTNPSHASAGFSTTCDACHKATDPNWLNAKIDHNQFYPLLGRHSTADCSSCHIGGVYKGTPTECVACHLTEYQKTTDPNHIAAGFPTTCDSCHKAGDSSWTQGRFNHSWFPITSGKHSGFACSQCHVDPNNYAVFSCTTCHTRTQTDSNHRDVNGYVYDSNRCYACHPNGRAG